jgi:nitrogen fixation protein NifU and related proteins
MDNLRELYEEVILDHNRRPRNYPKKPEHTNRTAHGFNPACGDEFHVHLRVTNGVIEDVGFEGAGCAISTASASMMTEAIKGKTEREVEALFHSVHEVLTEEPVYTGGPSGLLGKLAVLVGVKEYPLRVKCATLSWHIMHAALQRQEQMVTTE